MRFISLIFRGFAARRCCQSLFRLAATTLLCSTSTGVLAPDLTAEVDAGSPSEAAAILNRKIFKLLNVRYKDRVLTRTFNAEERDTPVTLRLPSVPNRITSTSADISSTAVEGLRAYLDKEPGQRSSVTDESFATVPLTRDDAARATEMLWQDHVATIRRTRAAEMKSRELVAGDHRMPFYYKTFGDKPEGGRSLYISLHGGGGTAKQVNDRQWENQKLLYTPAEGVYVVPRAPTNAWNLWHQSHIDGLFDRLIENMVVFEDVSPDRVYVMGYSAGGDGVYQLAPRMADRWAAAAMMAGHPNEASPLGLRNVPFTLHVGGRDTGYNRNKIAAEWQKKLAALRKADPDGYIHLAKIYPDKGHWLDREDAAAIPWMAEHRRNTRVSRIVWKQDDVVHHRFYWLAVEPDHAEARAEIRADLHGQKITIRAADLPGLSVRLDDRMLNLGKPIRITLNEQVVFEGVAPRTIATLKKTLSERGDLRGIFTAELKVKAADAR